MTFGSDARSSGSRGVAARAPRPRALRIDPARCIACATCETFVPGLLDGGGPVPMSPSALDAMAACPTGAIVWVEPGTGGPDAATGDDP